MSRKNPARRAVAAAAAAVLLALGIAGCSSSSSPSSSTSSPAPSSTVAASPGSIATVALPPGVTLSYIFPFIPPASANAYNTLGFQELMYRPLYYFGGNNNSVAINYPLSTAVAPVYSNGDTTVTITMKGWKWSDGETVNASDVVFWLNMMKAEAANYSGYVPGLIPDNLASYRATGPETVVLHLKSAVSSIWFTDNQLAELTPVPMAWDITQAGAAAGSGGCATDSAKDQWAKCVAVYNYLSGLAGNVNTYATSATWAVVDGPWKLSMYNSDGDVTFVPNATYSGAPKPQLDAVEYVPFIDGATEYAALLTGAVDVGYIPSADLRQAPRGHVLPSVNPLGISYRLAPYYQYGIQYYLINFHNSTYGPVFRQLYVRQALQEVMDQKAMIKDDDNGYGYPTSGAIPPQPLSRWIPAIQRQNGGQGPYAFSVANATELLTSHGWSKVGGVMTCEKPGIAATMCGAGIPKGIQLTFTMDFTAGVTSFGDEVAKYQWDANKAGIQVNLVPQSFNTIAGEATPCAVGPKCNWDILNFGGWSYDGPGYEPIGEPLFATGAASNAGSYSSATEDKLIGATLTNGRPSVFARYATYTDQQLPFIWMPNTYAIQAVNSKLANVTFNPLGDFTPEYWSFTNPTPPHSCVTGPAIISGAPSRCMTLQQFFG